MQNIYGVLSSGFHIDVSKTEKGAKRYATLNGYTKVTCRYNCGYNGSIIAEKIKDKWINLKYQK